jgi:hypothetical protein
MYAVGVGLDETVSWPTPGMNEGGFRKVASPALTVDTRLKRNRVDPPATRAGSSKMVLLFHTVRLPRVHVANPGGHEVHLEYTPAP